MLLASQLGVSRATWDYVRSSSCIKEPLEAANEATSIKEWMGRFGNCNYREAIRVEDSKGCFNTSERKIGILQALQK